MRVVFLGTPEFAVPALRQLLDNSYDVCGVFTQPDRPAGRGHKLHPSPIKTFALLREIPVFQPEKIRLEENRAIFESLRPDFIVVVAYGQILPRWVLQSARLAPVNIHASLLPRYRGAAPMPWAIMNGETVTGVSTMIMHEKLDSGPILMQQSLPLPPQMTTGELSSALSEMGAGLLIQTLARLQRNELIPMEQDESVVTWAPRITKEISRISLVNSAREIHNQIRGLNPWPVAFCDFHGVRLHIWRSQLEEKSSREIPGTLLGFSGDAMLVQCGQETVLGLQEVQMPGKSRISGRQFASGSRLRVGDVIA
jgi:methionyl-tRNA formyltransferase